MDITLIIPYDEGMVDIDGDISGGIRTYEGKLTLEQILALTEEPAYKKRAYMTKSGENGELLDVIVTFSGDKSDIPVTATPTTNCGQWDGTEFSEMEGHAVGKLSYGVQFSTAQKVDLPKKKARLKK